VRQQVNLYQPIFRKQEKKFSSTAMLQAIMVIFGGIVALFAWTQYQVVTLKNEIVRAEQQLATVAKRLGEVTQQFGARPQTGGTADEEIARLEQRVAATQRMRELLSRGLFSNTYGFSDYFMAFGRQSQYVPGIWLTGFDIVGAAEQLTLSGRSNSPEAVPRYMQKLSAERRLAGVEFQIFQMSRAGANVDFTLKTAGAAASGKAP